MALDLEEDAVHLVHEDHRLEDLSQLSSIVLEFTVQEVALKINDAVGGHSWELALGGEGLGVGQLTIRTEDLLGESGDVKVSPDKVVKHLFIDSNNGY